MFECGTHWREVKESMKWEKIMIDINFHFNFYHVMTKLIAKVKISQILEICNVIEPLIALQ